MGYSPKGKGNTLIPWHMVENVERHTHDMPRWTLHERIVHTPKGPISYVTQVSKEEFSSLTKKFWIVDDDADLERYLSLPYSPPEADTSDFAAYEEEVGERAVILIGGNRPDRPRARSARIGEARPVELRAPPGRGHAD